QLGHEVDGRLGPQRVPGAIEVLVAEILIDLPHPATLPFCRSGEQPRTAPAQSDPREPAIGDQPVELRDRRLDALEDQGSWPRARPKLQPVHTALERAEIDRPLSAIHTAEERLQGFEQFSRARLPAALQRVAKLTAEVNRRA